MLQFNDSMEGHVNLSTLILLLAVAPSPIVPGDVINLQVRNHPELAGAYVVSQDSSVFFDTFGSVPLGGVDAADVDSTLADELSEFFPARIEAHVDVAIRVHMIGEVNSPGSYLIGPHRTVADLVAMAGGVNSEGHLGGIRIERRGEKMRADLHRDLELGLTTFEAGIRSGDVVRVPRRWWPSAHEFVTYASVIFVSLALYDRFLAD